jgi:hypothetical protein
MPALAQACVAACMSAGRGDDITPRGDWITLSFNSDDSAARNINRIMEDESIRWPNSVGHEKLTGCCSTHSPDRNPL